MKYVAYIRTSTKRQNLGLDAQKEIINQFIAINGGEIVAEYSEQESGKKADRNALRQASEHAKKIGGAVIVAKVDRLTRDASFGMAYVKTNNIVFCDHPKMSTLEQCIFFGMAQQEREFISQRTKAALAVKKAQGVKLGGVYQPENLKKAQQAKHEQSKTLAQKQAFSAIELMDGTLRQKADRLNELGYTTPKGGQWTAIQVSRLIAKFNA